MRVTSGSAKGTHLRAPGAGVRPTSDRVKEALFNALAPRLADARVLDLFAGTGALGIEALSRGAARSVFIERDPRMVAAIRRNLAAAHVDDRAEARRGSVPAALDAIEREGAAFDLIVLDPPYGQELPARTLRRLADSPLLAPGGIIAADGHWRDDPGEIPGLRRVRDARYGETGLWFYVRQEPADPAGGPAKIEEGGDAE
ncbi:MAG TPA: 16S rRNA (guanine(966)-N(2))-methyltransferase RsmD [bacterium]|nr:16S rRNA (guanine(966)-N(2))-methyltransferase RsmD [bacterium]